MMILHILRHGKTIANEKRLYCGSTDLPLSDGGREAITQLAEQGIYPAAPAVLYTSGLKRAQQTAELIYGGMDFKPIPDLNEYDFGDFEMISYDDLKERENFVAWLNDETGDLPCPDGECMKEFKERVARGFDMLLGEMRANGELPALLVTHGGAIVSIMDRLFPDTYGYYEWQPETGRGYTLTFDSDGCTGYTKI
ncbi:MAG: histidine phosphatase family protein [Oscillospiraceae bacterium]|nr:histidine phosphatase family protein [Oscillospiraceae bacterium]